LYSVGFKDTEKEKHSSAEGLDLHPLCPLLLPFPHLEEQVTPLFSIKLSYLTPSTYSAWIFFYLEHKNQDFLVTD
jgi:hypothetical protein